MDYFLQANVYRIVERKSAPEGNPLLVRIIYGAGFIRGGRADHSVTLLQEPEPSRFALPAFGAG